MKQKTQDRERLEKLVDQLCKQQPLRKAPTDLYSRVMREVQMRKALPWWRKSFIHWPMAMQILFVAAAVLTARLALICTDWVGANWFVSGKALKESSLVQGADTVITVGNTVSSHLSGVVPMPWIYGAIAVVAVLYLVLFGIGVTTYKTLYAAR